MLGDSSQNVNSPGTVLHVELIHHFCLLHRDELLQFLRAFRCQVSMLLLSLEFKLDLFKNNLFGFLFCERLRAMLFVPLANHLNVFLKLSSHLWDLLTFLDRCNKALLVQLNELSSELSGTCCNFLKLELGLQDGLFVLFLLVSFQKLDPVLQVLFLHRLKGLVGDVLSDFVERQDALRLQSS